MATCSTIALEFADGTVGQVYCHWDGYLDHNGRILLEHWSDPFKLQKLIDLGDLSTLHSELGVKHHFDNHRDGCTFYGRDRGETGCEARYFDSFTDYRKNHQYQEYEYILRPIDGKAVWFVSTGGKYTPLAEELEILDAKRAE